jgi:hypothetical protein
MQGTGVKISHNRLPDAPRLLQRLLYIKFIQVIIRYFFFTYPDSRHGNCGRYSDLPQAGWSGDQTPVLATFSATFQTGPTAHPDQRVSFLRVKWPGRGIDLSSPCGTEVKERVELRICSPSGASLTLPFQISCIAFICKLLCLKSLVAVQMHLIYRICSHNFCPHVFCAP